MRRPGGLSLRRGLLLLSVLLPGCEALSTPGPASAPPAVLAGPSPAVVTSCQVAPPDQPAEPAFAGRTELSVEELVGEILARNPALPQMVAAWQAAQARSPQVTSLDDPMVAA